MSLARGWAAQTRVVEALILRETRTRFGRNYLGYLWGVIEPVLWIMSFWLLHQMGMRSSRSNLDFVGFIATGLIPYTMFRSTATRCISAIEGNRGLLFYPQIRPLDLVVSRSILEVGTLYVVFAVIVGFNGLATEQFAVDDPLKVIIGMAATGLLGATLGLTLCASGAYTKAVERIVSPMLRPLFFVSGIFFTANELPSNVREVLMFNPILHCVEIVRDGWFPQYTAHHASPLYPIPWILGLAVVGLAAERMSRHRVELT